MNELKIKVQDWVQQMAIIATIKSIKSPKNMVKIKYIYF